MAKSKSDHVVLRNGAMFCSHCGREQKMALPMEIPVFTAMVDAFCKSHKNCVKVWQQQFPDQSLTVKEKAEFWWNHGERGTSSEYMYGVFSSGYTFMNGSHPHDPDDFKRCHGLLEMVPEWRNILYKLRPSSDVWNNLVDNWDKLTEMLLEQMSGKRDSSMWDLMKSLGC